MEQGNQEDRSETILNGRWTKDQHSKFLQGLRVFGKNWKKIQTVVKSRSGSQIRSHAQKFFNKIERKLQNSPYWLLNDQSQNHLQNSDLISHSFQKTKNQNDQRSVQLVQQSNPAQLQIKTDTTKQCNELELMQVLKPKNESQSYFFDKIWKYPHEVIHKNFISTLVDLKHKRTKNNQNNNQIEHQPGKRKRSFVLCQNQSESIQRLYSFKRCKMLKKNPQDLL